MIVNLFRRLLGMPVADGNCPTCGSPIVVNRRYPAAICLKCHEFTADQDGRLLDFSNTTPSGGFTAWYRDSGDPYEGHICFINGKQCWADEAHIGGIVIQANSKFVPDFMTEEEYDSDQSNSVATSETAPNAASEPSDS